MKPCKRIKTGLLIAITGCLTATVGAQTVNIWRGNEIVANWTDSYKWKLKHVPSGNEAVHFREETSAVAINSTVDIDNGMLLYGQELSLEGNGNLNLWSPVPHKSTVFVPASATGYANLTLNNNLSVNGRIALAAKAYGTSASKGSITLKDRTTVAGPLLIGNSGNGSGKVFIRDQATYRISELKLDTSAEQGGSAEIHILGGTAQIECETDPFPSFLADPSRKIFMGDFGTLRINSDLPIERKKEAIVQLLKQKQLVAARGCKILPPVFQNDIVLIKAEISDTPQDLNALIASIEYAEETGEIVASSEKPSIGLADMITEMRTGKPTPPSSSPPESRTSAHPPAAPEPVVAATLPPKAVETIPAPSVPLAGYIVFFSAFLLMMRPAKSK